MPAAHRNPINRSVSIISVPNRGVSSKLSSTQRDDQTQEMTSRYSDDGKEFDRCLRQKNDHSLYGSYYYFSVGQTNGVTPPRG